MQKIRSNIDLSPPEGKFNYSNQFENIRFNICEIILQYTNTWCLFKICKSFKRKKKIIDRANDRFEDELDVIKLL